MIEKDEKEVGCQFSCTRDCTLLSFVSVHNITVYKWAVRHDIVPTLCTFCDCLEDGQPKTYEPKGSCIPRCVPNHDKPRIGLFCLKCRRTSKEGSVISFLTQDWNLYLLYVFSIAL